MKKVVWGLLVVLTCSCNQSAQDMHFGPGPDLEDSSSPIEECTSCGKIHK